MSTLFLKKFLREECDNIERERGLAGQGRGRV